MTYILQDIKDICPIIDEELLVLRSTLEENVSHDSPYCPMITFFNYPDKRQCAVVPVRQVEFSDTLARIAEALYLYSALNCTYAIVSLSSELHDENQNKTADCINVFLLEENSAHMINMPYTVSGKNVTWLYEKFSSVNVANHEFEGISKEMINMFYMFTHLEDPLYTVQELLSFLGINGAGIHAFPGLNVSYFAKSYS
jgi:hypothetical protein